MNTTRSKIGSLLQVHMPNTCVRSFSCAFLNPGVLSYPRRSVPTRDLNFELDESGESVWKLKGQATLDSDGAEQVLTDWRGTVRDKEREIRKHREFVKMKVIERKYFKEPVTANILTWKAKCQIKHMYQEDQDEDAILGIFPITRKALRLILKNKVVMKDEAHIRKHDKQVVKKWKELLNPSSIQNPQLEGTLDLLESGQITNIHNANGLNDLPDVRPLTLSELANQKTQTDAVFSSLYTKHSKTTKTLGHATESKELLDSSDNIDSSVLSKLSRKYDQHKVSARRNSSNSTHPDSQPFIHS